MRNTPALEGRPSWRPFCEGNTLTELAEQTSADAAPSSSARRRKGSGLDAMVLPELKQLASTLGLKGTAAMRKSQLIDAIQSAQGGSGSASGAASAPRRRTPRAEPEARRRTPSLVPATRATTTSPARWTSSNVRLAWNGPAARTPPGPSRRPRPRRARPRPRTGPTRPPTPPATGGDATAGTGTVRPGRTGRLRPGTTSRGTTRLGKQPVSGQPVSGQPARDTSPGTTSRPRPAVAGQPVPRQPVPGQPVP